MSKIKNVTSYLGPGFIIAATGVGAGDMVAATVAGANYGTVILWAVVLGAILKYVLNEGIARWQLSTGTTMLSAWINKLHPFTSYYFIAYLVLWSFIVSGALMAACGLAAHAIFPQISIAVWGIVHSLVAAALVLFGRYKILENIMKVFILMMFTTIMFNLFLIDVDWLDLSKNLVVPQIPEGSVKFIFGMIGGVGGSVTLLSYGYWLSEKGWNGEKYLFTSRVDLRVAYLFTGLFGIAIVVLAAELSPEQMSGNKIVLSLSEEIMTTTGTVGQWIFLIGFWGAVFSSMIGVWSGVPYIFEDFVKTRNQTLQTSLAGKSKYYKSFLLFLAVPPMLLLFLDRPVWIIVVYSVAGAFFMPFLAGTLLYLNNKIKWVKNFKNDTITNALLVITLILFVYLLVLKLI
ncbi:MAG: Nramp family divalent metal transporter [Cyclobacteriaceae bacterium]